MNEQQMIDAYAKLEGVDYRIINGKAYSVSEPQCSPIFSYQINCLARDKYHVEVDYDNMQAAIYLANEWFIVEYYQENELNHAVIEVILKANGLWEENK